MVNELLSSTYHLQFTIGYLQLTIDLGANDQKLAPSSRGLAWSLTLRAMWRLVLSVALAFALIGCGATVEPPAPVTVTVSTTGGATALIKEVSASFVEASPHISFEITQANTTRSLDRLAAGEVDLAIISYLVPDVGQFHHAPVARDGLIIIAHPDNRVENLTLSELRQLYSGKRYNWRDVGGGADDVQVVVRERGSGLAAVFEENVMRGKRITPNARVFPNDRAVSEYVSKNRGAIGYVSTAGLSSAVKVIPLEAVSPTPDNLVNGAYPLLYSLYAVTLTNPAPTAKEFANYLGSPAGQALVENYGLGRVK